MILHEPAPSINPTLLQHFWIHDCLMGKILVPKLPFYGGGLALVIPRDTDLDVPEVKNLDYHLHWYIESTEQIIAALKLHGLVEYSSFAVRFGNFYLETKAPQPLLTEEECPEPPLPKFGIDKYPYRPPFWTNMAKFHVTAPKVAHNLLIHCVDSAPGNSAQIQEKISEIAPHFVMHCNDPQLCNARKYTDYHELHEAYAKNICCYDFVVKLTDEMLPIRDHAQCAWETAPNLAWTFIQ